MSIVLLILLASVIVGIGAIMIYRRQKKPKRIIREGKLICGEGGFQGLARMYSFFLSDFRKTGSGPYHR